MGGRGSNSGFSSNVVYAAKDGDSAVKITLKDHKYSISETINGKTTVRPLEGEELKQTMQAVKLMNDPQIINGKYAGRFSRGTPEQLEQAERNLTSYIERAKTAIASAKYLSGASKTEHLAHHESSLKELEAQMRELQREKKRRQL